jgi:hypothetical protein
MAFPGNKENRCNDVVAVFADIKNGKPDNCTDDERPPHRSHPGRLPTPLKTPVVMQPDNKKQSKNHRRFLFTR